MFYLLSVKDESVLKWLFDSIEEALNEASVQNSPSKNLEASFEIMSGLSLYRSVDSKNLSSLGTTLAKNILQLFELFLRKIKTSDKLNPDCLTAYLSCVATSIDKLSQDEGLSSFMEELLEFAIGPFESDLTDLNLKSKAIWKTSLVFRVYASQSVFFHFDLPLNE